MRGFDVKKAKKFKDDGGLGLIKGDGTGTSDSIKADVPSGSYIMPADSTQQLGAQNLLRIIGKRDCTDRVGVVSVSTDKMDIAELAFILADKYAIATRVGLHCAPNAHKTLGTYPTGTLRFSFGWHNTAEEVNVALQALKEVLAHGL